MDDQRPFVMDEDTYQRMKRETSSWYWYNVATFFRCPWDENPNNADIAFVGVPHSSGNGSTERDQHLAPRFLRHVSGFYRRCHAKYGLNPWEECRITDMGDVPLPEAMVNDVCVRHIEGFYKRLDNANVRPVSIGGDHAITGPILKAIAGKDSKISKGRKAALIHFDAHTDAYEHIPHWLGSVRSAAHWAAYLVREGHVDPEKSTQIGIRGNVVTLDWRDTSHNLGYRVIGIDEFRELGVKKVVEILRERVGDSPVYITFDMDALDPVYAPAAANLEPGYSGMTPDDATGTLHGLRGLDVIGADVVCLVPTKDNPNNISSMNAMVLMFEQMCLIADRLRTLRGAKA
jgi:guanidinopropionase